MKKIILISLCLLATNLYAGIFDSKYAVYKCDNETDVNSCNNSCKKTKVNISFDVDKSSNKVLMSIYDGDSIRNATFDNCTIFDKKTFSCGNGYEVNNGKFLYEKRVLKDGRYTAIYTGSVIPSYIQEFTCAK